MSREGARLPGRLVLLGHPVAHSLSPRFQNAALRHARIPLVYEAVDVRPEALAHALGELAAQRAAGNVTVPHKQAVAPYCARRTPVAERVGAVNVFWTESDGLVGDNTDVAGFHQAVVALLGREPSGERVAVLGAGGAAAAVLAAIERWGSARAALYNRSAGAAERLAARFAAVTRVAATRADALADATLVVNATTVGLADLDQPMPIPELPAGAAVLDLVYRPGGTPWVLAAREAGFRADDGLTMLVEQGVAAFERWFGRSPDRQVMWAALR